MWIKSSSRFARILRSWWGRSLAGAFIGALLMGWVGIEDPIFFFSGVILGALVLFFLGRLE
jgi:hypothetical protein